MAGINQYTSKMEVKQRYLICQSYCRNQRWLTNPAVLKLRRQHPSWLLSLSPHHSTILLSGPGGLFPFIFILISSTRLVLTYFILSDIYLSFKRVNLYFNHDGSLLSFRSPDWNLLPFCDSSVPGCRCCCHPFPTVCLVCP